jgi:glycosyltransferase involved in cell wall biosynthesis
VDVESVANVTAGDVVVIVPARNEEARIGATVRAALTLPGVRVVIVVDDGSRDRTGAVAEASGGHATRLARRRGKGGAMAYGAHLAASYAPDHPFLLFLDGDLGESAANATPLLEAVRSGKAEMAIAAPPPQPGGGHGFVVRLARRGILRHCGYEAGFPLSGQRCLTREAYVVAQPLARRFGVEVGMTIDLVRAGFTVAEVPADLRHRVTGRDVRSQLHRLGQYRDVALALAMRRFRYLYRTWRPSRQIT